MGGVVGGCFDWWVWKRRRWKYPVFNLCSTADFLQFTPRHGYARCEHSRISQLLNLEELEDQQATALSYSTGQSTGRPGRKQIPRPPSHSSPLSQPPAAAIPTTSDHNETNPPEFKLNNSVRSVDPRPGTPYPVHVSTTRFKRDVSRPSTRHKMFSAAMHETMNILAP